MMVKVTTLSISHSLFLSKKQRYNLHEGKSVKIIGASMPVWFYKGTTSEPAEEVFCKYTIHNKIENTFISITKNNAYVINLPQIPKDFKESILSDIEWRRMSQESKNLREKGKAGPLEAWYESHPVPLSSKKLLDFTDGGSQVLNFKLEQEYKNLNIIHFILIKSIENLNESFVYIS